MTHIQIQIGYNRYIKPNSHESSSKIVTSRRLDLPFILYAIKYANSTTCTLKLKNHEKGHDSIENIMENPAFRNLYEKETSQITQILGSLLIPRQIQAQLCIQRESGSPVILQDIYNQFKKIKKDRLQGRIPIDALIETLKEEKVVWSSARDPEGHINSFFFTHPLSIKLLHGFPHVIIIDCTYKTNK
ncbi:hypothetical protein O181_104764 [Austropuccinia psidii MF-1]|uniref:Uncharacterized protein n=1 Tax=Austropuccinia psidii MF-1 TaxID=1389203 RepID=A0A9Q3JN31_9BASI|nr:hypothetical protein [Austropuccinia psidii MF-1]